MFYNLTYTINGVRYVDDCLTTALLADRIMELSREHDRGEGHYVTILEVKALTASLDVFA
jgi:hypothetical protein